MVNKRAILTQLSQPSVWRGLVMIASACGIALRPDVAAAITAAGMALAGLIGVLTGPDTVLPDPASSTEE